MPPQHGKSSTLVDALGWMLARWPQRRNAYLSYSAQRARTNSRKIRRLVRSLGVRLATDAAAMGKWETDAGGGLVASGMTSGITGEGFDGLIVIDDPIRGRKQAESIVEREAAWSTFTDDVLTRFNRGCSIILVATRWHHDDVIGRAQKLTSMNWETINFPAIRDEHGNAADEGLALWPEQFPVEHLRRVRRVDEYRWASLYQGHPVSRGGILFRVPARYETPRLSDARIVIAVDPAGTESTRADHTAAVVLAVHGHRDEMTADVLEVYRCQKTPADAALDLEELQKRHGNVAMMIEGSRDGKAMAAALKSINRRLVVRTTPIVGDKFTRSQPVVAAWNQGRVRLPITPHQWVEELIYETERFTGVKDAEDDQVDALAYAWLTAAVKVGTATSDTSLLDAW